MAQVFAISGSLASLSLCGWGSFGNTFQVRVLTILIAGSSVAFLIYGALCLSSSSMQSEFKRFGLENLRKLTGVLELLGGLGLLVGFRWPLALWVSSGGLFLLMLVGLGIRVKIRDSFLRSLPALILMIVNLSIFIESLK